MQRYIFFKSVTSVKIVATSVLYGYIYSDQVFLKFFLLSIGLP